MRRVVASWPDPGATQRGGTTPGEGLFHQNTSSFYDQFLLWYSALSAVKKPLVESDFLGIRSLGTGQDKNPPFVLK